MHAGFRYFLDWPGLMMIMVLSMLINFLLNPAASLLPLLVTDHFGQGVIELGWLESAFGLGILIGGIALSVWGGFKKKIITSMSGLIGLGIAFSMLGFLPPNQFGFAIISAFGAALMLPIVNGPILAILQDAVDPDMQGRVFSLLGSLSGAMAPLGLLIAGPLADATNIQIWFVIAGAACSMAGLAGFFIPAVMQIEENRKGESIAAEGESVPDASQVAAAV
ncbi:MAG: MFS transporter [Anaerolineae bacterium]|nr:MFS transporter [Anaerolineae bacterium]